MRVALLRPCLEGNEFVIGVTKGRKDGRLLDRADVLRASPV
jgi:hypothetical protein